ncbi:MAG: tRNA pseudouridine(13) synthase TruD [Planctomycetota bacterium]
MPRGGPAPRVDAGYKTTATDFVVEEVPAYTPGGDGTHAWLWIQKEGISTLDAVRQLARALSRREKEFGYAGLKDARAIARQWISIEHVDEEQLARLELASMQVLDVRRHQNKLKLGHLAGNRFRILLRAAGTEAATHVLANLRFLAEQGAPNYFGEQRFGKRGANLDKGLRILLAGNPKRAAHTMPRRLFNLVISAVQSEVFNRVLCARIQTLDQLLPGDVAWIHESGACFAVEDAAAEQPRCDRLEISPTGPLPGPKMLRPAGEMAALEAAVLSDLGLGADAEVFGRMPHKTHEGARRPLRLPVLSPAVEVVDAGLQVSFQLPPGGYATTVLRELLVQTPWFGVRD